MHSNQNIYKSRRNTNYKISESPTPEAANTVSNAADAAETGLAVIPMCAAVTLMLSALSGRIFALVDTSAIIGKIEYDI